MNMKRILFLALTALLLCLPVWAMAEVHTGYCGDPAVNDGKNVMWSYDDETNRLTISGTGDMVQASFSSYANAIKEVVINDGVTSIDNHQFSSFENLQSVVIGKDVVSIGGYAFYNCTALESINIPNGVTSIGEIAFSHCKSLKSIRLPGSLARIELCTFRSSGLESIIIPDSVTTIENLAFAFCESLVSVTIPESVTYISKVKWNKAFRGCTNLQIVKVPCSWHENPRYDFGDGVTLDFPGEWSKWTVTEPATTTKAGTEQRECGGCGHVESRVIPMLPPLPQTGDESNVILWSALACISLFGMTMLVRKGKEA